jgi:hypothetical protein
MNREVTVDKYDRAGVFVTVIETASQGPIVLETEGEDTSYQAAHDRAQKALGQTCLRWCVCRLVPVSGNELLPIDLQRMQK